MKFMTVSVGGFCFSQGKKSKPECRTGKIQVSSRLIDGRYTWFDCNGTIMDTFTKMHKDTQQLATLLTEGEVRRIKWLRQSGARREVFRLLIGTEQHGNRWGEDFKDSFNKAQEGVPESWSQIIVVFKVAPTLTSHTTSVARYSSLPSLKLVD